MPPQVPAMADSSILTLGTARSLLVDSSVYDSRIAENTKDHVFLGMASEDGEGQSAGVTVICPLLPSPILSNLDFFSKKML